MASRCNIPCLDERFYEHHITNWNRISEKYRGPGRILTKKEPNDKMYSKFKFHRMDGMRSPPDFVFLLNRKENDLLVHECQIKSIPVASLCDSDDSTRDLQYVIPCNTSSIQSLHFILDMITRGILEAQSKMDSLWYAKLQDQKKTRNALYDIELEWQNKYDLYEQLRYSKGMAAGNIGGTMEDDEKMTIPIDYDENDFDDDKVFNQSKTDKNRSLVIPIMNEGFARSIRHQKSNSESIQEGNDNEQNRLKKLSNVKPSKEFQNRQATGKLKIKQFTNSNKVQSTHDFSLKQLEKYAKSYQQ